MPSIQRDNFEWNVLVLEEIRYLKKEAGAIQQVDNSIRSKLVPDGWPAGIKELIRYIFVYFLGFSTCRRHFLLIRYVSTILTLKKEEEWKDDALIHVKSLRASYSAASDMAHLENAASVDSTEKDLGSLVACLILTSDSVESMLKIIKVLTEQPPCCPPEQPTGCVHFIA